MKGWVCGVEPDCQGRITGAALALNIRERATLINLKTIGRIGNLCCWQGVFGTPRGDLA
jgi:hypothetical protein